MTVSAAPLRFDLTAAPIGPDERRLLAPSLAARGLDETYWEAMNGLLTVRSRSDTPLALRAYRGNAFAGIAHLVECRRTSQCFFPGRLGRLLDTLPMPMYYWTRGDAAVDLVSSPGFPVPGEDGQQFYREAVAFLNRRYLLGVVMDERGSEPAAPAPELPFLDWGRCRVRPGIVESVLAGHKSLRRKVHKFQNKGGTLEVVTGALAAADVEAVVGCVEHAAAHGRVRAPFQENYANMARWAARSGAPGFVHVIARLDGVLAGYHAFLRSGRSLQCLSGGFDRTRSSNYHAYENILLEAMRYAEAAGLERIAFGPVSNVSKVAVMPEYGQFVLRAYSRFGALRRGIQWVAARSPLGSPELQAFIGIRPETEQERGSGAGGAGVAEATPAS